MIIRVPSQSEIPSAYRIHVAGRESCPFCGEAEPLAQYGGCCSATCRYQFHRMADESPTPDEIIARAAEVRAGWGDATEQTRRSPSYRRPPVEIHRFDRPIRRKRLD